MTAIPARDLRNNTAAILRRVESGEEFEVLRNDRPIALIVPLNGKSSWLRAPDVVWALERLGPDKTGLAADLADATGQSTDELFQ